MDANTQTIYEELKEVARSRQTLFYEDLSKLIDLPPRSRKFYEILDSINLNEYQEGRPLLSALAVRRGFRIPGAGFFIQAKKLGRYGAPARRSPRWRTSRGSTGPRWGGGGLIASPPTLTIVSLDGGVQSSVMALMAPLAVILSTIRVTTRREAMTLLEEALDRPFPQLHLLSEGGFASFLRERGLDVGTTGIRSFVEAGLIEKLGDQSATFHPLHIWPIFNLLRDLDTRLDIAIGHYGLKPDGLKHFIDINWPRRADRLVNFPKSQQLVVFNGRILPILLWIESYFLPVVRGPRAGMVTLRWYPKTRQLAKRESSS